MANKKITVVISQAQGKNPVKRDLEESLAAALIMDPQVDVSMVPHLYDLSPDHTGMLFLKSLPGDVVVLSWLYPRGIRWVLDRQNVRGNHGITLLKPDDEDDFEEPEEELNGVRDTEIPDRKIYCIDLRVRDDVDSYLEEIRRIADEASVQTVDLMSWIGGSPNGEQLQRYLQPEANGNGNGVPTSLPVIEAEPTKRRWYPVIDYDRCTNCMECIDFCLFGVYGVDTSDLILVEAQDNCKKGCPACSRVCPENAIIFPGHKTPAIAGADGEIAGLKIDLSQLFGGDAGNALEQAVKERDTELQADGREAVGMSVGVPKRQADKEDQPRDDLDDLMDGLDGLDL